jgi:FtsP/CotA-like multicopper oxidase with cupredoxin domain
MANQRRLSRRIFLGGSIGAAGLASNLLILSAGSKVADASPAIINIPATADISSKPSPFAGLPFMKSVKPKVNGFDPSEILTTFSGGTVSELPTGQILRQFTLIATNKTITVATGKSFPALAYNGQVPGPTLRVTQGDRVRITFINKSNTATGMHFSGLHSGAADALIQPIAPGKSMVYEFDAEPFGLCIYRGLAFPLGNSASKGLYGMLIIDQSPPRSKAIELFMTLNGFVLDSGGKNNNSTKISTDINSAAIRLDDNSGPPSNNDIYAINTVAYHFIKHPIPLAVDTLCRIYLVNVTEFDLLNSFHLHGNLFTIYRSGTRLKPDGVNSTVMLGPGQRAILEFSFKTPGKYIFHSYQGEYADLGCMGMFNVR